MHKRVEDVLKFAGPCGMNISEIRKAAKLSRPTVYYHLEHLLGKGIIDQPARGVYRHTDFVGKAPIELTPKAETVWRILFENKMPAYLSGPAVFMSHDNGPLLVIAEKDAVDEVRQVLSTQGFRVMDNASEAKEENVVLLRGFNRWQRLGVKCNIADTPLAWMDTCREIRRRRFTYDDSAIRIVGKQIAKSPAESLRLSKLARVIDAVKPEVVMAKPIRRRPRLAPQPLLPPTVIETPAFIKNTRLVPTPIQAKEVPVSVGNPIEAKPQVPSTGVVIHTDWRRVSRGLLGLSAFALILAVATLIGGNVSTGIVLLSIATIGVGTAGAWAFKKGKGNKAFSLLAVDAAVMLSIVVILLPILAIVRGGWELITMGQLLPSDRLGITMALLGLFFGTLFFCYSIKYYFAVILVLIKGIFSPEAERTESNTPHLGQLARSGNGRKLGLNYQPFVSIHVASYNEKRVIDRLMNALDNLDYKNYEVIWADDSTDESEEIRAKWQLNPKFKVLHRLSRSGFKGGALSEAIKVMDQRSEYVVVFDADSIPFPDAMQRFLPYFYKENDEGLWERIEDIGAVQSYQWHVLNKSESWLTEAVRAEYSGSYMVERVFQEQLGAMKMVAGTAYMIRADLLKSLGWGTSLTEDWELTLKLYMAGFKVAYTPYAESPAECVSGFWRLVRQRMRWAEGHSHNVRKYFFRVLSSSRITLTEKTEFCYYSVYYIQAVWLLLGSIFWGTSEWILHDHVPGWTAMVGWSLLFSNLLALPLMNIVGLTLEGAPKRDLWGAAGALATSLLLSPFQGYAAVKGFLSKDEGPWFRTPKTGKITNKVFHISKLRNWLLGGKRVNPAPVNSGIVVNSQAASKPGSTWRAGWVVVLIMALGISVVAYGSLSAPLVYANPDLFYLHAPNTMNSTVPGAGVSTKQAINVIFSDTFTSTGTYPGGSVIAAGTYKFNYWTTVCTAGNCPGTDPVTMTIGYCVSPGCTGKTVIETWTPQIASDITAAAGATVTSPSIAAKTLPAGGPYLIYFTMSTTVTNGDDWSIEYSTSTKKTNMSTPLITVDDKALIALPLALLIPLYMIERRKKRFLWR